MSDGWPVRGLGLQHGLFCWHLAALGGLGAVTAKGEESRAIGAAEQTWHGHGVVAPTAAGRPASSSVCMEPTTHQQVFVLSSWRLELHIYGRGLGLLTAALHPCWVGRYLSKH